MSARLYMLLDILEKKAGGVIQNLRETSGVVALDPLEGHPNFLLIVEAPDRQRLVESVMPVLSSIERVTEDLRLLLIRENYQMPVLQNDGNMDALSMLQNTEVNSVVPANALVS
jgi:hypothetical protein